MKQSPLVVQRRDYRLPSRLDAASFSPPRLVPLFFTSFVFFFYILYYDYCSFSIAFVERKLPNQRRPWVHKKEAYYSPKYSYRCTLFETATDRMRMTCALRIEKEKRQKTNAVSIYARSISIAIICPNFLVQLSF